MTEQTSSLVLTAPGCGPTFSPELRGWRAAILRKFLRGLDCGRLTVGLPGDGRIVCAGAAEGPDATIVIHRWRLLRRVLIGGDVAFGEAFVDGDWSSPDVATLVEFFSSQGHTTRDAVSGSPFMRFANRLRHVARRNTPRGSRRNIRAHYDLGNQFYAHWLDAGMSYSSAIYRTSDDSLEAAQDAKLDAVVAALDLRGGERVLEIGCGWGGMAERLAREGCHVTGVTLSPAQLAFAQQRMAASGLADRATLVLQDYRTVEGRFDRVVSIEMIEAVGHAYLPQFFRCLRDRLVANGSAVLQAITIADERFPFYARTPDFIQRHIFPGGMLPSPGILRAQAQAVGLAHADLVTFGQSYARTLAEWRDRFVTAWPAIHASGFESAFGRLWEYYLSYCEGAFRSGAIDVGLYRLTRQ